MIQQKQVSYAKEIDDVMVLLIALVADVKAKKTVAEIAADALPKFIEAISGIDGAVAEFAADKKVVAETIGYRLADLEAALTA